MKKLLFLFILTLLPMLASADAKGSMHASNDANPMESLYGEWWLVGWNDGGNWFESNYVRYRFFSIKIPREGYVMAYSMVNEIFVGLLILNGNEMIFSGDRRGFSTEVNCDNMENLFFEDHICDIKYYQLEGKLLKLYYTDNDYFVFTSNLDNREEGQDDYHPFVKEGKKWICSESVRTNETVGGVYAMYNQTTQYTLRINGDTIIGGTTYKKVYKEGVTVDKQLLYTYPAEAIERMEKNVHQEDATTTLYPEFLREADKKVYARMIRKEYGIDKEYVLYDFSVAAGEKVSSEFPLTNTFISSIDTIEVKGRNFRRYRLGPEDYGGYEPLWVEGVGHPGGPFLSARAMTNDDMSYKLLSCYEDGECIFTNEDFNAQTSTKPDDNMAYRPFVEEGKVWTVGSTTGISDGIVKMVDDYYFDGDTIIGGKACKQMWCQRYVSPDHPDYAEVVRLPLLRYVGAWYEENQKVYFYDENQRSMRMMYDFSLGDYDILQFLNKDGYPPLMIGPKQTGGIKGFKGVYKDIMISTDLGTTIYSTTWLEGVGCIDGPTMNAYYYEKESRETFLMSCVVGDEVIYLNDEYEDGATPEEARKKRFDFTHTIKIQPKTPKMAPRRSDEQLSLYGEYNDVKLGINLNPLDDAYLVRITNESGQIVYEKTVNAGNIVALSIDISAYAKGCYTVTVENSSESFTGEFEVQTTGISDAVRLNDKEEMIKLIYNLHGQRLSSLQKGLNIVNGQKFYVR